jgi:glycosyltransferase involved in cell wall biosynthesis
MSNIAAVVIARNEEERIRECIENLSFCKEVILVNNGSEDKTAQIAESLGAKVVDFESSDFSELRNFGLKQVTSEWILYVDADEMPDEELKKELKKASNSEDYNSYFIKRKNYYLGNNEWPYVEKIKRLFKKDKLEGWFGQLHESPKIEGKAGELAGFLIHKTHRSLEEMVNKTNVWSETEAMLRFNAGHPKMSWWRFFRVMFSAFVNSYIFQKGYKAKTAGLVESMYQTFSIFITYAKLWELQQEKK